MKAINNRRKAISAALAGLCALAMGAGPAGAVDKAPGATPPIVTHTGKAPTGYEVTFRYADPKASRVQIKGEWLFERPGELPLRAPTPDHPTVEGQALPPSAWQPGDVPLQHPNSTAPNWPIEDMKKGKDGVWTYTVPLPSGVYTYALRIDCMQADADKCKGVADPSNPSWAAKAGLTDAGRAPNSQVYVPSDPAFHSEDLSWQGPAKTRGKLAYVAYPSPTHTAPAGSNFAVVYTPPGYDPARPKPYPTFYLSHGGGENEMGWSTQGDVANILDNLIGDGEVQPMVVVMPNAQGFPNSTFNEAYDHDVITALIPYVEGHYHVSASAKDRAFSGLSMGGMLTNSFIINHPDAFGYYGMMSAGLPPANAELTPAQAAALKGKSVWVGGGWQDVIFAVGFTINGATSHLGPAREVSTLAKAGVPVTTDFVDGGHEWHVWRILLKDFLTRTAFLPQPYAAWQGN